MREDGVRIDKIVVTNDGSTPSGVGPPESPQGNTPPNAVDDNITVVQDSTSNILDVLNNDTGALSIDAATTDLNSAQGGTVVINGSQDRILYTPPAGYTGPDNFDYGISDGNGAGDTATVSVTVDPTGGGGGGFQQSNGLVSIEAEHAHNNIARSSHAWTVFTTLAGFSGTSAMEASPDNKLRITSNIETTSPQLDYQINFSDSGAHVLWIRGNGPKFASDSMHAGLNGGVTASITVPHSIGSHTLNIWMREDGVRIDKIVVTNDGSTPSGVGPPESTMTSTCQSTPSVSIDSPEALQIQSSSDLTVSTTACLDPVTHAGWGVKFVLDETDPLQIQEIIVNTAPFETTFSSVEKGEHTVKVQLVDENDVPQSGSNAQQEVQQIGIGDYIVAMGDSITFGVGDDDPTDDTCSDGRVTGGGYPPILCTELNNRDLTISGGTFPHFIANEGIPGDTSADGVAIINSVLANHPEAQQVILWFGMNDARPSNATMSGLNLDPGDTGYNGTYKHNMQQMIDAAQLAKDENGVPLKEVVLVKINIALADCAELAICLPYPNPEMGARSLNIIQYNLVIDDIRDEMNTDADPNNDITVVPPNFFDIFNNLLPGNPGEYIDNIHPSGQGYDTAVTTPGGWVDALCPSCLP
jgi:lysophospholipase L1-like esterase